MNIYIYQSNEQYFNELKDICIRFLIKNDIDAEIISYSEKADNLNENISVFLIENNDMIKQAAGKIYNVNNFNYIVITSDNFSSIHSEVFPCVRPSGFIIRPFEYSNAEKILISIFDNFNDMENKKNQIFNFKVHSQEFRLPFSSILYFESSNKKIKIRTASQEFETYLSLEKIENIMPSDFIRIHKGFIINISKVCSIDYKNMLVSLENGSFVPVSRSLKNALKEKVSENGSKLCSG